MTGVRSDRLTFEVVGVPTPKGSVTRFPNGGMSHGRNKNQRDNQASWATAVTDAATRAAANAGWEPCTGPVRLLVAFEMPRLASSPGCFRTRHIAAPDLDKLLRHLGDCLTAAGIIRDDRLICEINARKVHTPSGRSGAVIVVEDVSAAEADDRERLKTAARTRKKVS